VLSLRFNNNSNSENPDPTALLPFEHRQIVKAGVVAIYIV
jgi:hypothetical protein